jgi:hypothetical protein
MNLMTEKILFMSTSTLAGNPRLVKEFEALKFDYKCFVICFQHLDWSEELSNEIKNRNPEVTFTLINRKESLLSTLFSKFIHKLAILLNPLVRNNICISGYAINDKTYQLKRLSKKILIEMILQKSFHTL